MSKSILIIESNLDGHYGIYLKKIVNFFLQRGNHIFLAVNDGSESNRFLENLIELEFHHEKIQIIQFPLLYRPKKYSFLINLWIQVWYWNVFRKIYNNVSKDNKVDLVFIPYLDRVIYAISILGSPFKNSIFSGIIMRPTFHHYKMGIMSSYGAVFRKFSLKYFLFIRFLKINLLNSIFTIDLSFSRFSKSCISKKWAKIRYFPDPVDQMHLLSKQIARHHFGVDADNLVLLLYGSIDMRKGVLGALEWTIGMRSKGIEAYLLILGSQSKEVQQYLKHSSVVKSLIDNDALYLLDRFITTEEEVLAFSAADLVWLRYDNFDQMSGVMVKAGMADLPMALPDRGVMGWYKDRLLKSSEHQLFSIPRLKVDPKLNPFLEHTWENSLFNLSSLIE